MRHAAAVIVFVLLLRVPFLNQAIQGDDVDYLRAAEHAQIDPAHPQHVWFIFQGAKVTMQGHPHPPLNAWFLAALLAVTKDVNEVTYHAAYIVFSMIAGLAALALALRFTTEPLLATLLFLTTPAFVINGNSLESDLPFLAFWLAAVALFVKAVETKSARWLTAAAAAMACSAMTAFQALILVPILAIYLWQKRRDWLAGWLSILAIPAALGGWQLYERLTSDVLPAQVLAGYFKTYGLQTVTNKLRNAAALTAHLGFPVLLLSPLWGRHSFRFVWFLLAFLAALLMDAHMLFAVPFAAGVAVILYCARARRNFLAGWVLIFFAAALILFFAGAARYLLPAALPVALLVASIHTRPWLIAGITAQLTISLMLATVNYQHWNGYRQLVHRRAQDWENKRIWVNAAWGLRYYAELAGALPVVLGQPMRPGDIILTSRLALPVPFSTGGGALVPVEQIPITSPLPFRLIGLDSKSGYSAASAGLRALDIRTGPIDIVRIDTVVERKPTLSFLPMNAPEADQQIVSGIDRLEENRYRWMLRRGVLLVKKPPSDAPLEIELHLPEAAPARRITLTVDGAPIADRTFAAAGTYKLRTAPIRVAEDSATVTIEVDKTFQSPGDQRELGVILVSVGFR
ncbi:MAG TPA: glycosyltransferase family 39 protein [Bryobacteraceae bacterium]|nr:glycosyltransferase family 39 protein [Bryobacteraceae bacterium]